MTAPKAAASPVRTGPSGKASNRPCYDRGRTPRRPFQHMKLIGSLASPFTRKARVVLAEKKIEYDFEIDNPWDGDTRVPGSNPLGKVPVLVLDDGTTLFDSRVIVEFLDNASPLSRLLPAGNRERIEVRRWEALADGVVDAGVLVRMEQRRKPAQRSPEWTERQMGKVASGLAAMNADLADRPWCAGSAYTIADIAVGVCLGWLDFRFPDLDWRKEHSNLARALAKLSERASFADTAPRE
jgi:glutathione S-transferase